MTKPTRVPPASPTAAPTPTRLPAAQTGPGAARPIIFTGESVRAILAGTKTQTRRVIRNPGRLDGLMLAGEEPDWCPYGRSGETLWVREGWAFKAWSDSDCRKVGCPDARTHPSETYLDLPMRAVYRASYNWPESIGNWRSPIHMPRWASRITLELTDVRVQRLQEISEEDAKAEGVGDEIEAHGWQPNAIGPGRGAVVLSSPVGRYRLLWDSINAKRGYSWASNPWVWCLTFRRVV